MNTKENLQHALDLLRQRGWIRCHLVSENGYCATGAIYAARTGEPQCQESLGLDPYDSTPESDLLEQAILAVHGPQPANEDLWINFGVQRDSVCTVLDFNDDLRRTFPEIEAVFEKAVELAGGEEA